MLEKEGVHGSGSEEGPVSGGQEKVREQAMQIATQGCPRKWGSKDKVGGVCLETEYYPDCVHHPDWPQPITKAGVPYHSETRYKFN